MSIEYKNLDYETYVGTSAPFSFNGLVRHYYLREGASVAEVQVNLLGKHERRRQSHEIARTIRPLVETIAVRRPPAASTSARIPRPRPRACFMVKAASAAGRCSRPPARPPCGSRIRPRSSSAASAHIRKM